MADRSAGRRRGERRAARVGKQVEHADGAAGRADLAHDEVPVDRLLGEQAGVLKRHGLELEGQFLIRDGPLFGQAADLPLAAAGGRAVIDRVCPVPDPVLLGAGPDGLGVGAPQDLVAPALELLPAAAVKHLIVCPCICNPHVILRLFPQIEKFLLLNIVTPIGRPRNSKRSQKPGHACSGFQAKKPVPAAQIAGFA